MPGIVGLITKKPSEWAKNQVCRMLQTMKHEPFYSMGTWADERLGVYVGWSALANSFAAAMPVTNERGDVVLILSGEEFSRYAASRFQKTDGTDGESSSAAYLLDLYEQDAAFPVTLDGMFHGCVVDRSRGTAMLFNDRYGMHRINYHEANDGFYFAAEAKAILAVRPELRTANLQSLGEFVACSCILQDRTLFQGIYRLPAGSAWTFRNGTIHQKTTYFRPREWEEQIPLEFEVYYRELRDAMARNLPKYFHHRQRIGIALTGGLDTRVIMAWQKLPPDALSCYTFRGPYRDSQDVLIARRVASACRQSHQVITVNGDFTRRFPHYAERTVYLTEGNVDVSRSPDLYVSERARKLAPVKVVGTYGSEIIRQSPMFKPVKPAAGVFAGELSAYVQQAESTYGHLRQEHPLTFAAFRQSPWYHSGVLALEQSQLSVRSPFLGNDFVRTVFRAPMAAGTDNDIRLRLISDGNPALARIRSDRGVGGASGRLCRMLSRAMLEFSFRSEYAYDTGMPHWLARLDHVFSPLPLERMFLGRHKFYHFRVWYRNALSKYVRQILLDPRTLSRPYVDRKRVEGAISGHVSGTRNYTTEIHKLLSLELLHRLFLDA